MIDVTTWMICPASQERELHDWRLWSRKPYSLEGSEFDESAYFALTDPPPAEWREVWYCTRCRKFEERTVMLDGS
jgi:hypothetical protein